MAQLLIVDDDPALRDMLSQLLGLSGHACDTACDGQEGLERIAAREYDVVVSDISMPRMGGLQLLREARPYLENKTPCIIMTAFGEWEHAMEAIRVGASCFLLKSPFDRKEVLAAVARALDLRQAYRFRLDHQRELARLLQQKEQELADTYDGTVIGFASMMEGKDTSTMEHLFRVRDYVTIVAAEVGIPAAGMRDLQLGAMLHDVGKYRVPDAVLTKPGPLTPEEWALMRRHPEHGADFVRRIPFLARAAEVILHHHERWDGSGYPQGLAGERIPLAARVFAVVDAFDAIVSERCYKAGATAEHALAEIKRCSGTHFDPRVVEAFERALPRIEAAAALRAARMRGAPAAGG